jgi:hypothetical protein
MQRRAQASETRVGPVMLEGRHRHRGMFDTAAQAARAYDL